MSLTTSLEPLGTNCSKIEDETQAKTRQGSSQALSSTFHKFDKVIMLEEIISCFLSLFSALTLDAPRISRELQDHGSSPEESNRYFWEDQIDREYASFEQENLPSSEYVALEQEDERTYATSLLKSVKGTLGITLAVLPLVAIGTALAYFDLRTVDLCSVWSNKNYTLSFEVARIRLIGAGFGNIVICLWFPFLLCILFGWSELKSRYSSVVLVGQLASLVSTLYLSFLLLYRVVHPKTISSYDFPELILYPVVGALECIIVVRKIRQNEPRLSYSSRHIFTVVAVPIFGGFVMGVFYKYVVVASFNSLNNVIYRVVVAISTPTLALVPTAICRHLALRRTSEIIDPGRSFGLVYAMRAAFISLYRIMQADFKNIWLFLGLSVLSGVSNMLKTATLRVREKVWAKAIRFLNKTCCIRLRQLPHNTPHYRRLKADTEIQNILFESGSLILSQFYIVLYTITNFEVSDWIVVKSSLIRIMIGLAIELLFNLVSNFIHVHYYNIPITRVWSKHWKRHMFANIIVVAPFVCYFTKPLLAVYQDRFEEMNYTIRNCTLPYDGWR